MEQYLIDTNVVSDYLTGSLSIASLDFLDAIIDKKPCLSIITKIELLCWKTDIHTKENIKRFVNDSIIFNISDDVISYCVKLRQKKKIKTPDAIIAATALANKYTIITKNFKDFEHIKGLKIINPDKI